MFGKYNNKIGDGTPGPGQYKQEKILKVYYFINRVHQNIHFQVNQSQHIMIIHQVLVNINQII